MKDATCVFLDLPESKKLTSIECETSLMILTQVKKLLLDAESTHYSDVGLKYSKDFIARIVVKMLPMMGRNWNLRGYSLILNMKREGSNVRLGKVTFDFSKKTTHEFILTLKEEPTPRWHYYVPEFFKFMLQGPVTLSPEFEIRKRTLLNFEY